MFMRNQLAAIELRSLVSELKQLEGSWLDQVYDLHKPAVAKPGKTIVMQLSTSEGKRFIVCVAPYAAFMSSRKPAVLEGLSSFCRLLRHHLANAKLVSVSQMGSERILELVFWSKNRQVKLIIELFSKGNIILVDERGVILGATEHQTWKDRTVRPGFAYSPPPAAADFSKLSYDQLSALILSSKKDSVVKALAIDLGLSGIYAEELCASASVDKSKKPQQLSQQEIQGLFSSLQQLLSRKPSPIAILDDSSSVIDVFPFPTASAAATITKSFPSFNEAVEAVALPQLEAAAFSSKTAAFSGQIKELETVIGQQRAAVAELSKAAGEATKAAEFIYEHYMEIKQVLEDYNRLRKAFTPDQLKEYFSSNKLVRNIDEKTGQITLEI